jgi:hypothetical protein
MLKKETPTSFSQPYAAQNILCGKYSLLHGNILQPLVPMRYQQPLPIPHLCPIFINGNLWRYYSEVVRNCQFSVR